MWNNKRISALEKEVKELSARLDWVRNEACEGVGGVRKRIWHIENPVSPAKRKYVKSGKYSKKNARATALIKREIEKERARKEKRAAYMREYYRKNKAKK